MVSELLKQGHQKSVLQGTCHSPFRGSWRQSLSVEDKALWPVADCKCFWRRIRAKQKLSVGDKDLKCPGVKDLVGVPYKNNTIDKET